MNLTAGHAGRAVITTGKHTKNVCEYFTAFVVGGTVYGAAETLWRGYTHWTMLITGGVCLSFLYALDKHRPRARRINKLIFGAAIITVTEFIAGCIVNLKLGWNVWDYSAAPYNLLGQICAPYALIWLLLCIPAYGICGMIKRIFARNMT